LRTRPNYWATGADIAEKISEPARAAFTARLKSLNDDDLTQLFRSARLHLEEMRGRGERFPAFGTTLSADAGADIVARYKQVWRNKVNELDQMRCPPSTGSGG